MALHTIPAPFYLNELPGKLQGAWRGTVQGVTQELRHSTYGSYVTFRCRPYNLNETILQFDLFVFA